MHKLGSREIGNVVHTYQHRGIYICVVHKYIAPMTMTSCSLVSTFIIALHSQTLKKESSLGK